MDTTSWLIFFAGLINQMGRVMIPAIKTSVMADAQFGPEFKQSVGKILSGVSLVCMGGKMVGAAVTDRLGGWVVLGAVFAIWIVSTVGAAATASVHVFFALWLFNSLAYTVTWGAQMQVIGATYDAEARPAQISNAASSSRFGATIGNIVFGQLLSSGLPWRRTIATMIPLQVVLGVFCAYKAAASSAPKAAAGGKSKPDAAAAAAAEGVPPAVAMRTLEFWLLLVPKALTFTFTQFFMNYIPQLLNQVYGYSHGAAASLGGVAQGGSVVGLLVVGNMLYKKMSPSGKVTMTFAMLAVSTAAPLALAAAGTPGLLPFDASALVVPLAVVWGGAYVLPFYLPVGEYAAATGGKRYTALYANLFDGTGFVVSALWNPWASASSKGGDFTMVLLSQAAFGAVSAITMPLAMARINARGRATKKQA